MAIHGPLGEPGAGQDCAMAPAPSLHLGVSGAQWEDAVGGWVLWVAAVKQQI
jgi:hypothetical protein